MTRHNGRDLIGRSSLGGILQSLSFSSKVARVEARMIHLFPCLNGRNQVGISPFWTTICIHIPLLKASPPSTSTRHNVLFWKLSAGWREASQHEVIKFFCVATAWLPQEWTIGNLVGYLERKLGEGWRVGGKLGNHEIFSRYIWSIGGKSRKPYFLELAPKHT